MFANQPALRRYVNRLHHAERFRYASDYAQVWLEGGREPHLAYYEGVSEKDAQIIRNTVRLLAVRTEEWASAC